MRSHLALAVALSAFSFPVSALEANDTMASWKGASVEDKNKLVAAILRRDGREIAKSVILRCLDEAANVPGHAELSIGQVVKACEDNGSEPV